MQMFEYIDTQNKPYDIFYTSSVNSPNHWHHYSEIIYIISGQIKLICESYSYILVPGDICYMYPLQLHEIVPVNDNSEPVNYAVIKFDVHTLNIPTAHIQKMYDYFVNRTAEQDYCQIVKKAEIISNEITSAIHEFNSHELFHMFKMQSNIINILIYIARHCDKKLPQYYETYDDSHISFYHILEYIDIHSSEKLDIANLAQKCHLSYSQFAKRFRETYGRSCKKYITYIRLNKADELLKHTNYDISYIASQTGFFDSSHFIKAYKEWKGETPKQQRIHYSK